MIVVRNNGLTIDDLSGSALAGWLCNVVGTKIGLKCLNVFVKSDDLGSENEIVVNVVTNKELVECRNLRIEATKIRVGERDFRNFHQGIFSFDVRATIDHRQAANKSSS